MHRIVLHGTRWGASGSFRFDVRGLEGLNLRGYSIVSDTCIYSLAYVGSEIGGSHARSALEEHRFAMDRTGRLMRFVSVQLEVLNRVMQRKQAELKRMVAEKSVHIAHANAQLASKSLPILPDEIIAKIFNFSYFVQSKDTAYTVAMGVRTLPSEEWQPIAKVFADDSLTPEYWRRLVQSVIPVVVTQARLSGTGEFSELDIPKVQALLGTRPMVVRQHELGTGTALSPSSTTLMVTPRAWREMKDELEDLCRFPWNYFVFAHSEHSYHGRNANDMLAMVDTLIRECGNNFADLDRLVILPFHTPKVNNANRIKSLSDGNPQAIVEEWIPRLRAASLPLRLLQLPGIHRILKHVTELELCTPYGNDALSVDFEELSGYLRPFCGHPGELDINKLYTGGTHLAGCKVIGLKPVEPRLARRLARRLPTGLVLGVLAS